MCCESSSEPSRGDGSDEESQHMVLCRIHKKLSLILPKAPSYLEPCNCTNFFIWRMDRFGKNKAKKNDICMDGSGEVVSG